MAQATVVQAGRTIDYTPGSDIDAGEVVKIGDSLAGFATRPIDSGDLGALMVEGVADVVKKQAAISAGAKVFWDADGDPYGGTAGTGCATWVQGDGDVRIGLAIAAAEATDETVRVLWLPNKAAHDT